MKTGGLCIFGEVLFDHFPDGSRVLGGAPFNVAWHLQAFGLAPCFISRVGEDAEGAQIREAMTRWGMATTSLQRDGRYPTGRVSVELVDGEPAYDIVAPCAYDVIDAEQLSGLDCRLLYHGSLALRHEASRQALQALKDRSPQTVFVDVNLRPPWWRKDTVMADLADADWVKLNQSELDLLWPSPAGLEEQAASFVDAQRLRGLIVTRGEQGAVALTASGDCHEVRPAGGGPVVDTVGAGDAFASMVILGLMHDWPLTLTLQRAQEFASRLVGNRGATIDDPAVYQSLLDGWQQDN